MSSVYETQQYEQDPPWTDGQTDRQPNETPPQLQEAEHVFFFFFESVIYKPLRTFYLGFKVGGNQNFGFLLFFCFLYVQTYES